MPTMSSARQAVIMLAATILLLAGSEIAASANTSGRAGTAAPTGKRSPAVQATLARALPTVDPCARTVPQPPAGQAVSQCVVYRTQPNTADANIFRLILDLVACIIDAADLDSMYPGVSRHEVESCMAGKGY